MAENSARFSAIAALARRYAIAESHLVASI